MDTHGILTCHSTQRIGIFRIAALREHNFLLQERYNILIVLLAAPEAVQIHVVHLKNLRHIRRALPDGLIPPACKPAADSVRKPHAVVKKLLALCRRTDLIPNTLQPFELQRAPLPLCPLRLPVRINVQLNLPAQRAEFFIQCILVKLIAKPAHDMYHNHRNPPFRNLRREYSMFASRYSRAQIHMQANTVVTSPLNVNQ